MTLKSDRGGIVLEVLPLAERTTGNLVRRAAAKWGSRPFVLWRDEVLSFADIDRRSNRAANALRAVGVGKGTRVAILCANCPEFLDVWFGLAKLGAVQLPLNTAYKAPQILHTLTRADVPVVVVQAALAPEFEAIAQQLSACRYVVTLDGPIRGPVHAQNFSFSEIMASASSEEPVAVEVGGNDIGAIMNTSGTTGMAKGVLLPQGQQYWLGRNMALALELGPDDVFYNFFPLFHNTAQAMITIPALLTGARMLLTEKFSLSGFWNDVRVNGVTVFYYIGEILHLLVKTGSGDEACGTNLRAGWGIGGAPNDVSEFERRYGVRLGTGYGSTEGNVPVFRALGVDSASAAAGKVLPEFEVCVADATGCKLPTGEVGEILTRSAEASVLMAGYDGNPDATADALRDGWYHSGDAGRFDDKGNLTFVSRIKDVIRVRGENVSAFEIEDALLSFPGVLEAAAIAVPSEIGGDDIKAVVVPSASNRIEVPALLAHCDRLLPKFSVPRYVEICDALPKTVTNKVQKHLLRENGLNARTWDRTTGSLLGSASKNNGVQH